jgi:predicted Zn-dependent protease
LRECQSLTALNNYKLSTLCRQREGTMGLRKAKPCRTNMRLLAWVIMFILPVISSGCGPILKEVQVSSHEVAAETETQREIAFAALEKKQERLHSVSTPLLVTATKMGCTDTVPRCGFNIFRKDSKEGEYRDVANRYFGKDNVVRAVIPGMPAANAGLKKGDVVIAINGVLAEQMSGDLLREELQKGTISLSVEREGSKRNITMRPVAVCNYTTSLMPHDPKLNAYADGSKIYITNGMMRFIEGDEELAMVVAHEIAHNLLGHMDKKRGGAALGTFFDLLIAGVLRVNTGGALGRAGAKAYSKEYEAEADYASVYLIALAGYDITNAANIWRRLAAENPESIEKRYAGSHPSSPERFVAIENTVKEIKEKQKRGQSLIPEKRDGSTQEYQGGSGPDVPSKLETNQPKGDKVDGLNTQETPVRAEQFPKTASTHIIKQISNPKALEWLEKSKDAFDKSNWTEVIRTASAAIATDSSLEDAYLNRAWAYYKKGFFDEVVNDSSKAIEINPGSVLAYNYRGLVYSQKGMVNQAFQQFDKALQLDSKNPITLNNRGVVYQKQGNKEDALKDYKASCDSKYELACENYKKIAGFYPADIPKIVIKLIDESNECFQKADWDGVIMKTSEALKFDGSNVTAYVNRAGAYANKKMLKEATEDCDKAIRLNPDYGLAYNNRGYVYELLGQTKQAKLDYEIGCNLSIVRSCDNLKRLSQTDK